MEYTQANAFRRLFILSQWFDTYISGAESALQKMTKNYGEMSEKDRKFWAKFAIDNLERAKIILSEIAKLKYRPFSRDEYLAIMNMLTRLQYYLVKQRYGDRRTASMRRTKEDLVYVQVALSNLKDDLNKILIENKPPLWYTKISTDRLKKSEEELSAWYIRKFGVPLVVSVYI